MDYIVCCAILYRGHIYSVDKPGRHDAVIRKILAEMSQNGPPKPIRGEIQGFLDQNRHFLDRKQAMEVAKQAKQLKYPRLYTHGALFSEDLW